MIDAMASSIRESFQVLDLTLNAARGALFGEADRQAPAHTGDKAGGGRAGVRPGTGIPTAASEHGRQHSVRRSVTRSR